MSLIKNIISKAKGESISLGLDIGHYSIKAASISHSPKGFEVLGVVESLLPKGTVLDGTIQEPEALQKEMLGVIESLGYYGQDFDPFVSLSWSSGVLADQIKLVSENPAKEEELILFEAGSKPPFDEADITLDYSILNRKESSHEVEVLIVAAKNALLNKWADFFHASNVKPLAFDIDAFSALNAFMHEYQAEGPRVEALVNFGFNRSHITFVKDGKYHSTRDLKGVSVTSFVKVISRKLNVKPEDAILALQGDISSVPADRFQDAYESAADDLSKGISQAISFFESLSSGRNIDKINIFGGGAYCTGLSSVLSGKLSLDVDVFNPLMQLPLSKKSQVSQNQQEEGAKYAVALGLAMRTI